MPIATTPASASLEELGSAGKVAEFDHAAVGWWVLDNGNVLVATPDGIVTAYMSKKMGPMQKSGQLMPIHPSIVQITI